MVGRRAAAEQLDAVIPVDEVCDAMSGATRAAAPGTGGIPAQWFIEARPHE